MGVYLAKKWDQETKELILGFQNQWWINAEDACKLMNSLKENKSPNQKDLVWALTTLLDGVKKNELQGMTGLQEETIDKIWGIYEKALKVG